ncbi:hypothetical protein Tco_0724551 [Tanacetum coccineum]
MDDRLIVSKSSGIESENNNALSKSVNETQLQQHESLVTESTTVEANLTTDVKALDAGSVITESSGTKSDKHDTSISSGTFITHAVDADIRPVNDQVPFAEVQLTAQHNVLANEQQHTEQSEPNYDTYLSKRVIAIPPRIQQICVIGERIDQMQERYYIKKKKQKVLCLRLEKMKLNKENDHLKQTYKELYDSIKRTRIQTKDHNDSLIDQVNSKTVENADLKAQIQARILRMSIKNELSESLKRNKQDTKFAKPSILGKPVLQPPRNQSVVRQPNAFKSERPNFSKPRFASQVDVNNILSKPVTPYYLPKVREYVLAKPHHVIAPGSLGISRRNRMVQMIGS